MFREEVFVIFSFKFFVFLKSYPIIPNFTGQELLKDGDVKIGILYSVHSDHTSVNQELLCEGQISSSGVIAGELVKYRVENINLDSNILPNITLGFIYLDTCGGMNGAVARVSHFLANSCPSGIKDKEVFGVVGPFSSSQSIPTSGFASQFHLPILATFATSDELSDKVRFEYFSRLAPPDSFITQAMIGVMVTFKWTYIQLVFSEGSYGENAAKSIQKNAKAYGICIGNSIRLSSDFSDDYIKIARKILSTKNAKIIVLIMSHRFREKLISSLDYLGSKKGDFIIFSADSYRRFPGYEHVQHGTLHFFYKVGKDPHFESMIYNRKKSQTDDNWMKSLWERLGNCNYSTTCSKYTTLGETGGITDRDFKYALKVGDGVEVYARALNHLISDTCPEAFQNKSLLKVIDHLSFSELSSV